MVETDVGDDRQHRPDDVGRVEPAAQSGFDDGEIDVFFGKIIEGHGRGHLEEGGMEPVEQRHAAFHERNDALLWNHFTVDADAFPEILDVRGGEQTCLVACALEQGGRHVRHGTFAVGAGHMDDTVAPVRASAEFVQRTGPVQPRLVGAGTDLLEFGQ